MFLIRHVSHWGLSMVLGHVSPSAPDDLHDLWDFPDDRHRAQKYGPDFYYDHEEVSESDPEFCYDHEESGGGLGFCYDHDEVSESGPGFCYDRGEVFEGDQDSLIV